MTPPPAAVRYNDWRQIDVAPLEAFRPVRPASVIVPYHEAPQELARTLAALERQTYPRDLFEVVIVDDGSRTPLERPRSTPLDVRVVHQERRGFGLARARNAGAAAATHDVLVFLDQDMLPEADWLAAHARWHHAAGDVLTQGFDAAIDVGALAPQAIVGRPGSLRELFADRPADGFWMEPHLARTGALTSRDDDLFRVTSGGNLGIGRAFFRLIGGYDASFVRWGGEDTEFGWRAWTRGGVLVPVREAFAWHQGRRAEDRAHKDRSRTLQRAKLAHLIAHEDFRVARAGVCFAVPRFVVTLEAAAIPQGRIAETVEQLLAGRASDLVVRIALPEEDARRAWLQDCFDPEPRVRVAPAGDALDEFPAAPFHVALPAGVRFARGLPERLCAALGPAVAATAMLPDGSRVSITRARALQRARRTGRRPADFGDAISISRRRLRIARPTAGGGLRRIFRRRPGAPQPALARLARVRTPREACWFIEWLTSAVRWGWTRRRHERLRLDAAHVAGMPRRP